MLINIGSPEFLRRLAVTLAALAVYALAFRIPLYGINPAAISGVSNALGIGDLRSHLSIGALGVTPIFAALCLAELVRVAGPRFLSAGSERTGHAPAAVLWLALVFALTQGANIAVALENIAGLRDPIVSPPSLEFRVVCVANMVAATALFWWLATQITRYGVGSGFWLLFVAPFVAGQVLSVGSAVELVSMGAVSVSSFGILIVYATASAAVLVLLYTWMTSADRAGALLWPALLAPVCINAFLLSLVAISYALDRDVFRPAQAVLTPGLPVGILVEAALIVALVYLRNWRSRDPLSTAQAALTAIAIIAIVVVGYALVPSDTPGVSGVGSMIVATTIVVLAVVDAARRLQSKRGLAEAGNAPL